MLHFLSFKKRCVKYIKIDDEVYFKDTGDSFGTIVPYTENSTRPLHDPPATEIVYVEGTNEFKEILYPLNTRVDAEGKIKCIGSFASDGTFMLNGSNYIAPGQTFTVCTEKVTLEITITDISKINN